MPDPSSLPPSVRIVPGGGGLPVARVRGRAGDAEIYLQGAQVTAWAPTGARSALWMSSLSRYTPGAALRGGVPICFPWFGPHASDRTAPAHGFARRVDWQLVRAHEDGDDVVLAFRLTDTEVTRSSAWPHRFEAVYTVTVGSRLTLSLQVTNRDCGPVVFEEALHTYLRVPDIRATSITGLESAAFEDRVLDRGVLPGETGPLQFGAETDRIYPGTTASVTVDGGAGPITMAKDGSDATVVWNPWSVKAAAMADFGQDEWTGMVCVEACNVREGSVHLSPGASHTMTAVFALGDRLAPGRSARVDGDPARREADVHGPAVQVGDR
jgi:D-hexose-6-phosphate mutarotase